MDHHHAAPISTQQTDDGHVACDRCIGRRTALMGMGAVGVAGLLAACGGDDEPSTGSAPTATTEPDTEPSAEAGPDTTTPSEEPAPPAEEPAADALATTADVPVGSGFINDGAGVVITQPAAGTFLGFSSTCTHQGCAVTEIDGDVITCTCHGSQYSAVDGSVVTGPATEPLAPVAVVVEGDQILPG